jgi:hypothetical protein
MDTVIIILFSLLVVMYYLKMLEKKAGEHFAANYQDQPNYAPTNYNENIAGINEAAVKPITINDYANNLAYNPRDPASANYLVQGRRPWSPNGFPHPGNADGQDGGRQFAK